MANLSVEEYKLIDRPFDLQNFETFLSNQNVTDKNRKLIMRTVTSLHDPAHALTYNRRKNPKDFGTFWYGKTISSNTNFHLMKTEAAEWVSPEEDLTRGWIWSHPINWCIKYQHFLVSHSSSTTEPPAPPTVQSTTLPVGVPIGTSEKKTKAVKGHDPTLYQPPGPAMQQVRYAGLCTPLKKYLQKQNVWKRASIEHWKAISAWTKTEEGRAYLRDCQLDPEGIHLDHIFDKHKTPLHHAWNCYFMPSGANSHFGDRTDAVKKAYVGEQAATLAEAFLRFYIIEANKLDVDCSKFNHISTMMG
jgi:hypothetical protein